MKKNDIALAKATGLKRLRNRVRLETSILADRVINELVDEYEFEFERRLADGEPYELDTYEEWVVAAVKRKLAAA